MSSKTSNGQPKRRKPAAPVKVDLERRLELKEYFDALSPAEHERELKKLSSEDLFFLVADTIRANYQQNGQSA